MRGAAVQMKNWEKYEEISTHAPHARRGVHLLLLFHRLIDFYSRASCEARLNLSKSTFRFFDFYSRASCEARLLSVSLDYRLRQFLLTRLMRGAAFCCKMLLGTVKFLLTRLMRGAAKSQYIWGNT